MFEDHLRNRPIEYGDVACRLFSYSLGEEAYHWFIHLPAGSITSWEELKDTFIGKFGIQISPSELHRQFVECKRQENEPINSFNNRFQKAYTRLQTPYLIPDAQEIYYHALDPLTTMFVRTHPSPANLNEAYAKAIEVSKILRQNLSGPLLNLGSPAAANQIQNLSQALVHHTPIMNQVPQPMYPVAQPSNQWVLHPGAPISQAPQAHPVYLQNAVTSTRTQEEKEEMKELIDQVKKLSTEVTHLRNQNNQLYSMHRNYQGGNQNNNQGYQSNNQNYQNNN